MSAVSRTLGAETRASILALVTAEPKGHRQIWRELGLWAPRTVRHHLAALALEGKIVQSWRNALHGFVCSRPANG